MQKERMLNALEKLKKLNSTIDDEDQSISDKKYFKSAWEFTYAEPKPPLNANPNFGSGIQPRKRKQGE